MKSILIFALLFFVGHAQASDERPKAEGTRTKVAQDSLWVGKLFLNDNFFCAAWILDHGTVLTAKHCFQHEQWSEKSAQESVKSFSLRFGTFENLVRVQDIDEIHFDSAENDIIIIRYQSDLTASIALPKHEIFKDAIPANIPLTVVGFPGNQYERVATTGCRTTGFRGKFESTSRDQGYDGVFDDTTCGAWYGNSGGPVFHQNDDGSIVLYGVLTHTFDVWGDGSLNGNYIEHDEFGFYMPSMFSALSLSADLP